jgi:uncharacterized protein involved in exopolysaccharide biosynthesis
MADRPKEKTIGDILQVVFSHYKLFLAGFAMFIIGTMVVSLHVPVKYTATALFERRSDSATERLNNNPNESFSAMKLTLEQELCSPEAVEAVIGDLGMLRDLPRDAEGRLTSDGELEKRGLIHDIRSQLLVEWKVQSRAMDQIALQCTYTDSKLAAEIPNRLVTRYLEGVSSQIITRLRESRDFLREQVTQGEARVEVLNQKKIEFESTYNEVLFDNTSGLQDRIQATQSEIENLYRQLLVSKQKVEQYKGLLKTCHDSSLKEELETLRKQIDENLTLRQMTDEHPDVLKLKARIAQLEQQIQSNEIDRSSTGKREMTAYESGLVLELMGAEGQVEALNNESDRLQRRLTEYQTGIAKSVPVREEYLKLTKPITEQQAEVDRWQKLLSEVDMTLTSEEGNRRTQLKTIALAKPPYNPKFPPFWTIVGIALGGGLAFAYGLVFMASTLDHSIRTPEDAAEGFVDFDVPVVGVISEIMMPRERAIREMKRGALTLVLMLVLVCTLCFSTYCVLLRLESPDNYKAWKSAFPVVTAMDGGDTGESIRKIR